MDASVTGPSVGEPESASNGPFSRSALARLPPDPLDALQSQRPPCCAYQCTLSGIGLGMAMGAGRRFCTVR